MKITKVLLCLASSIAQAQTLNRASDSDCKVLTDWLPSIFKLDAVTPPSINVCCADIVHLKCTGDQRIAFINLNDMAISGPLPASLGKLSSLTGLSLFNNNLTGSIPKEFGLLSKLTDLVLDNNQFSGPLPRELTQLSSLSRLNIYNNKFSGPIPNFAESLIGYCNLTPDNPELCIDPSSKLPSLCIANNPSLKNCTVSQLNPQAVSVGTIVGAVIGVLLLLLVLGAVGVWYYKRSKLAKGDGESNVRKSTSFLSLVGRKKMAVKEDLVVVS